jgi:hypothetical protein
MATKHLELFDEKKGLVFYCPSISKIMAHNYFMSLNKCIHITNLVYYIREKGFLGCNELEQTRWLINAIQYNCKRVWKLGNCAFS